MISLGGFAVFYGLLFLIEIFLMFKFARLGPSSIHTGRYHHERTTGGAGGGATPATAPQRQET
jgi:cytochrome d ubiquinol oxidase subunit I